MDTMKIMTRVIHNFAFNQLKMKIKTKGKDKLEFDSPPLFSLNQNCIIERYIYNW